MSRLFENISDSIIRNLNESVYEDNKKVKNAKKQYNIDSFKKPRIMRGTVDTENVGSTKSIEKKIERTPYKKPHKATKKVVAESDSLKEAVAYINGKALKPGDKIKDFRGDEHEFVGVTAPGTAFGGASGKIQVKSGDSVREFYPQVFKATIKESENLKEADTPFVDNLISDIEDGMFTWEEIARACLKYMSEMDIRDMCRSNEFYNMDDLDEGFSDMKSDISTPRTWLTLDNYMDYTHSNIYANISMVLDYINPDDDEFSIFEKVKAKAREYRVKLVDISKDKNGVDLILYGKLENICKFINGGEISFPDFIKSYDLLVSKVFFREGCSSK